MTNSRFRAVDAAFSRKPMETVAQGMVSEYFGCNVFSRKNMRKYLPSYVRRGIYESIEEGRTLDKNLAENVAEGMKRWAMDMGATHYTHWFQPLTGETAEKHDSFIQPSGPGDAMESFTGKVLCQQEPDASSFPSGGLRNTFEARGYTAWDPSSPAFVIGDTLCIPTVFISYNGEALDYKTPLLRSCWAVGKAASDLLEYFGTESARVIPYLGWEQEFFLIDSALYAHRPDLLMTGRTLMGHESAKSQQLEDHYFGSIPQRVLSFFRDLETECYKLGIPIKTRHNEVAPNQFEIAPVYEEANLAIDHNLMLMSMMKPVAKRHGFRVLFHEKPYRGVNGSGKHCNWSIGIHDGPGLFSPGRTDSENLRFLAFMSVVLMAVYKNNGLLKASIASSSNAHRLGANEAPPMIISAFLGSQLKEVFEEMLKSRSLVKMGKRPGYSIGIPQIPEILVDNTDRNRTSPFAFVGDRFEFRAVGSSANCSLAITTVNTIVADELALFISKLDEKISAGVSKEQAILETVREYYGVCKGICFDGNNYSEEWREEAARRGLDCETSVPKVYEALLSESTVGAYERTKVLTRSELEARAEVLWEQYSLKTEIEARVMSDMVLNHILPVATSYQTMLLENVSKIKDAFPPEEFDALAGNEVDLIRDISRHMYEARRMARETDLLCDQLERIDDARERALGFHDTIRPYLDDEREHADSLEMIVDDQMWPLPKYREMLFIH